MLIGGVGAFVLASTTAARRVDSAYRTLIDEIDAPDLAVIPGCEAPVNGTGCVSPAGETGDDLVIESLLATGVVERARSVKFVLPSFVGEDGSPLLGTPENVSGCFDGDGSVAMLAVAAGGATDQVVPFRLWGELQVAGSSGVVLSRATAERAGVGIGQDVRLAGWCNSDGEISELDVPIDLRVSGLSIGPLDVEPPATTLETEPAYVDPVAFQALVAGGAEPRFWSSAQMLAIARRRTVKPPIDRGQSPSGNQQVHVFGLPCTSGKS